MKKVNVDVTDIVLGVGFFVALLGMALIFGMCGCSGPSPTENETAGRLAFNQGTRWRGHDFAFCFVTDDGRLCNLGWAEAAQQHGFTFTVAANHGITGPTSLTHRYMRMLNLWGIEIANHGKSHAKAGLPESCPIPPRGSLPGYFMCGVDADTVAPYFRAEISREGLAVAARMPTEDVRVFAYPNQRLTIAIIDSLMAEGYLGARSGAAESAGNFSYGELPLWPRNTWEGGISLFRIPTAVEDRELFGDHSADPPVHYDYEQFRAAAMPHIEQARQDGGIFVLYAHHFGDDDDSYGSINYGKGGVTPEDLVWMVDLVRRNGGLVLPLGEAVEYYRSRSEMTVTADGDYVWVP